MKKDEKYNKKRSEFLNMLLSADRDQLQEFIKNKGREPKTIKPFICLDMRINE